MEKGLNLLWSYDMSLVFWLVCMGHIPDTILLVLRAPLLWSSLPPKKALQRVHTPFLPLLPQPSWAGSGWGCQDLPWSQGIQEMLLFFSSIPNITKCHGREDFGRTGTRENTQLRHVGSSREWIKSPFLAPKV